MEFKTQIVSYTSEIIVGIAEILKSAANFNFYDEK